MARMQANDGRARELGRYALHDDVSISPKDLLTADTPSSRCLERSDSDSNAAPARPIVATHGAPPQLRQSQRLRMGLGINPPLSSVRYTATGSTNDSPTHSVTQRQSPERSPHPASVGAEELEHGRGGCWALDGGDRDDDGCWPGERRPMRQMIGAVRRGKRAEADMGR